MTLRDAQSLFMKLLPRLIDYAYAQGYELTAGQLIRTQAEANANALSGAGISRSLHMIGLAIDLNLFKNGVWLTTSNDHKPLGDYWKTLDPLCCWGGDFKPKQDGNHYSLTWEGRK